MWFEYFGLFSFRFYPQLHLIVSTTDSQVGNVPATDCDTGENSRINYRIINGNEDGKFRISNGVILLNETIDFEEFKTFQLTVEAMDNGADVQLSSEAEVCVYGCGCGCGCGGVWCVYACVGGCQCVCVCVCVCVCICRYVGTYTCTLYSESRTEQVAIVMLCLGTPGCFDVLNVFYYTTNSLCFFYPHIVLVEVSFQTHVHRFLISFFHLSISPFPSSLHHE